MNKHTLEIKTEKLHIYIRVSSDTQLEDGFGLQNQKEYGMKVFKPFFKEWKFIGGKWIK